MNLNSSQTHPWWEQLLVLGILLHIIIQACFPNIEKQTLWGEFFILISFFAILKMNYSPSLFHKRFLFLICTWMLVFPVYGLFIAKTFWDKEFNTFFLFRHFAFFYYGIFFLLAFKYAYLIADYLGRGAWLLLIFIPITNFFFGSNAVGFVTLYGFLLMGVALKFQTRWPYYFALSLILLIFILGNDGGTGKMAMAFLLAFIAVNVAAAFWIKFFHPLVGRILLWVLFLASAGVSLYLIHYFHTLTRQLAGLGDSITALIPISQQMGTDLSGMWRPVLWSHLYGRFLEHPWGVGIGTPLFEKWLDGFVMLHLYKPGENYVQGAHNSFVTFIARLGIPALVLFSAAFFYCAQLSKKIFRQMNYHPFKTAEGRFFSGALLGFAFMCVSSSFNVALESPLYAGTFWFSFGLFARIFGDAA